MSILLDDSSYYTSANFSLKRSASYNPKVHQRDHNGNTLLLHAVSEGREEEVESIIDEGADVNAQNFAGETPLYIASARGFDSIAHLLLENGATVTIANLEGATPLHIAAAGGHDRIVEMLAKYGAYVNAEDDEGDRPLHWAVREGCLSTVSCLLKCGADLGLANEDGETPVDLAECLGDNTLLALFNNICNAPEAPVPLKPGELGTRFPEPKHQGFFYGFQAAGFAGVPQSKVHNMIVDSTGGWLKTFS
jgi:ankyrin repeat protein